MGVINTNENKRLKALDRQKMLYNLHCNYCVNKNVRTNTKYCPGCAIWDEFKEIGKVLDKTIAEREESA
ncbi:MAG: hypothetical protein GX072_03665 [Lysinibacillus sp.]|nr:hypothetical protein [Lysinibacillus sp.]